MITRRQLVAHAALAGGAAALIGRDAGAQDHDPHAGHKMHAGHDTHAAPAAAPRRLEPAPTVAEVRAARRRLGYTPVTTPDGVTARWRRNGAFKEFHLVAHEVEQEFAPGMTVRLFSPWACWNPPRAGSNSRGNSSGEIDIPVVIPSRRASAMIELAYWTPAVVISW